MERINISHLENLLRFPGATQTTPIQDASILTCGCLVSESSFLLNDGNVCPNCKSADVSLLSEIKPLRELYRLIDQLNSQASAASHVLISAASARRRRSSGKRGSVNEEGGDGLQQQQQQQQQLSESMDLLSLFYKFAKEEEYSGEITARGKSVSKESKVQPIDITATSTALDRQPTNFTTTLFQSTVSISPGAQKDMIHVEARSIDPSSVYIPPDYLSFEKNLLQSISEQKEYNFTKCFPFHRKLSSFPTQQLKFNFPFKLGSIKKAISTYIHSYLDFSTGKEITRFVLINSKRWEVYEYIVPLSGPTKVSAKPQLICCGKLSGEFSESLNNLNEPVVIHPKEIIIRNDFNSKTEYQNPNSSPEEIKKRLQHWDQIYCHLTKNYLVISGTRGIMRVYNLNRSSSYKMGQSIYTYLTNFPIRCISVSPNEALIACGITAKERVTAKEQPFVILHRIILTGVNSYLDAVNPMTITIPYRDPIKILNFNASSSHLICGTLWESRYLVIKLKSNNDKEDNYRKPRLIWSDFVYKTARRTRNDDENGEIVGDDKTEADSDLMMSTEGMTDVKFGNMFSNTIVITSCSLKSRPPIIIRLDGAMIDSKRAVANIDNYSFQNSVNSLEEEEYSSIISAETIMRIPEVGSLVHKATISPTGDGIVFLAKDGSLYLLSGSNFKTKLSTTSTAKKIVVLLGEVANAERFSEAASVLFSPDGGKVFTVDRKGVFSIFDFTKGVPGEDPEVIKCKIISI